MSEPITEAEVAAFLRAKLEKAEKAVASREDMAACAERPTTPAEWKTIMAMTPPHARGPMPTDEERAQQAATQRRIAEKLRLEARMYRLLAERQALVRPPCPGIEIDNENGSYTHVFHCEGCGCSPASPGRGLTEEQRRLFTRTQQQMRWAEAVHGEGWSDDISAEWDDIMNGLAYFLLGYDRRTTEACRCSCNPYCGCVCHGSTAAPEGT